MRKCSPGCEMKFCWDKRARRVARASDSRATVGKERKRNRQNFTASCGLQGCRRGQKLQISYLLWIGKVPPTCLLSRKLSHAPLTFPNLHNCFTCLGEKEKAEQRKLFLALKWNFQFCEPGNQNWISLEKNSISFHKSIFVLPCRAQKPLSFALARAILSAHAFPYSFPFAISISTNNRGFSFLRF